MVRVGVAIINFNRLEMLRRCVDSLEMNTEIEFALVINDVGSTDGSREWIMGPERTRDDFHRCLLDPMPRQGTWPRYSYAQSVNRCARFLFEWHPEIEFYYPLNNDNYVHPAWLSPCLELFARDEKIGWVGSKVLFGSQKGPSLAYTIQSAGAFFKWTPQGWQTRSAFIGKSPDFPEANQYYDVDYTGFGCYRRDLFERFGGLCEDYPPIYWDDPDWGLTLWTHGYRVVYCPESEIVHDHLSEAQIYSEPERQHHYTSQAGGGSNRQKFMTKWAHLLKSDGTRSSILPSVVGC